jgi:hypothetical protein
MLIWNLAEYFVMLDQSKVIKNHNFIFRGRFIRCSIDQAEIFTKRRVNIIQRFVYWLANTTVNDLIKNKMEEIISDWFEFNSSKISFLEVIL